MTRKFFPKKPSAAVAAISVDSKRMQEDFGVDDAFCSIRYNRNTRLENQKLALSLLDATEATLREKNLAYEPANYFLALWPLVDNEGKEEASKMGKGQTMEFNSAVMYLISFVTPKLAPEFIRQNYSAIYNKLPAALTRFLEVAPFVRAAVVLLQAILSAFTGDMWEERSSLDELLCTLLQLAVDARPKVRKLSQDTLISLVRDGTFGPDHPAKSDLITFLRGVLERATRKDSNDALHTIPLLRSMAPRFTAEEVRDLLKPLLRAASLGNTHLTIAIYNLISFICELSTDASGSIRVNRDIVKTVVEQRPDVTLTELIPAWLNVFSHVLVAHGRDSVIPVAELEGFFITILENFLSTETFIHQAVEDALCNLYQLVRDESLGVSICGQLGTRLQVKNWPAVPSVIKSAGDFCEEAGVNALPAASDLLQLLATAHDSKQARHAAIIEKTIGKYIARCGPEAVLQLVPLNLDGAKGVTPRAWLLPILKDSVSHACLNYFGQELLPLAECLAIKSNEYEQVGKANDAKIYQVLVHQVWSCLSAFLKFPVDFAIAFEGIAPVLGRQLNSDVALRPVIANALTAFIHRSRAMQIESAEGLTGDTCGDLAVLSRFCGNFLPILFNVFGVTVSEQRGYLLECIEAFISICDISAVQTYFDRIISRLHPNGAAAELVALLELSLVLVHRLDLSQHRRLMATTLSFITATDVTVQKRAYKVVGDLISREDYPLTEDLESLEHALLEAYNGRLDSSVKKGRFHVLLKMTAQLPEDALHWVPLFLPEAVLGTKEINQQARLTAFELLLAFARRMSSGSGVIHAKKTRGMLAADVKASLSEFMTMLLAGLAGSTPHMISATMMAIARILFELRTAIDAELLDVLLGDVIAMLHSPSREVVKSSLGFLKVALAALRPNDANNSVDLMERHLETLVPGLLNWANEHHQQFKVRVRHLMERLVRRFGFERVWALTPIDHRKLLTNIRKRRERAKRHKEQTADAADETEGVDYQSEDEMAALTTTALSKATTLTRNTSSSKVTKPSSGFEDALNNSESDLGNSDDDYDIPADSILHDLQGLEGDEEIEKVLSRKLSLAASINNKAPAKNKKVAGLKRLVESDDEGVRVAEDGKLMISDDEDEGTVLDSDEEEGQGSAKKKATTLTIKRAKKQRGDAKRRGDKFEPFTYLPMMRASKESTGEGRTKDKKASKYYMKRS